MWRPTIFFYLFTFYGQISSQPVTDISENVRQPRQLDYGECCPCPSGGQDDYDFGAQESSIPSGDSLFSRARNLDDCPCRSQHADSEGASSIFFPKSMRSDEPVVRSAEKKEDPKPLLHPEVDLASSVLQTLREATDEEYREALARDAARSIARAAEETIFGDAVPEASNGNIVTIIVKPKSNEILEEEGPRESHLQQPRCTHTPLERKNMNLNKLRVPKSQNMFRENFEKPELNRPAGILRRNFLDMDSNVGASNVQEHLAHINDGQVTNNNVPEIRKIPPLMKLDLKNKSTYFLTDNNKNDNRDINTVPNFKLPFRKNMLKDLLNRSPFGNISETNAFPLIPKMRLNNTLSNATAKNYKDVSPSPSNIQGKGTINYFKTKSHLENLVQKTRPLGLKNVLKLKDVELVPLKQLVQKAMERPMLNKPTLTKPAIFFNENDVISSNNDKNQASEAKTNGEIEKILNNKLEILDHEVSPSTITELIKKDDCLSGLTEINVTDDNDAQDRITPDNNLVPPDNKSIDNDRNAGFPNLKTNETTNNDIKTSPVDLSSPQSIESVLDKEKQDKSESNSEVKQLAPLNVEKDQNSNKVIEVEDFDQNMNNADLISDSTNKVNNVFEPKYITQENNADFLVNKNANSADSCSQEQKKSDNVQPLDRESVSKLIKPLSLDKSLASLKESIIKKITGSKSTANILNKQTSKENQESFPIIDENFNSECQNEDSFEVTTLIPDISTTLIPDVHKSGNEISMQDLQKMSDSMLQQEDKERESKPVECDETSEKRNFPQVPLEFNNRETDADHSPTSQNEVIMDNQNFVNNDNNEVSVIDTCQSDVVAPGQQTDANSEASEVVVNSIPTSQDIVFGPLFSNKVVQPTQNELKLLNSPIPDIHDAIKLPPFPTLDEISLSLTDLFDKTAQGEGKKTALEANSMTDTLDSISPIMATDASTTDFQLKPFLNLEDLDFLQLKPQTSLASKISKTDLHAKTNLALPTNLRLTPVKLQPPLQSKGILGGPITFGNNNVQGMDDLSNSIHNHAKNTLRSMKHTLESKLRQTPIKSGNLQTHDLLEVLSRNHEDINDKLKALQVDFNDRLETMRNNIIDKSRLGSSKSINTKSDVKSFNRYSNQNKGKQSILESGQSKILTSRREPKKPSTPRRYEQQRKTGVEASQRLNNQKKFKMPAAASVPVPRTIDIPELKTTLTRSPGLAIQKQSDSNQHLGHIQVPQAKVSSIDLWKDANKKLRNTRLGKPINPLRDSKIIVSFSTTPRPAMPTRNSKLPSTRKTLGSLESRIDHNGSPSEVKNSIISPSPSSYLNEPSYDESIQKSAGTDNFKVDNTRKPSRMDLKSWPNISESVFLSKVKDAVESRLSKVNSPAILKHSVGQPDWKTSSLNENESLSPHTDMARLASDNVDVVEGQSLKENVSYKCTMVCTKE